ncbi:MAG TPA: crossover junction endodeoxyribonuclease RuvC, partial [Candidatus Andersenbacteria bacterium]|nr:crossover junction endodeoxyribonuclease RuvC [Candidatus Andersenbacteria bacterium]
FFGKNTKTAISTSHVRGVLLQILAQHHIPVQALTPLQIKSRLTGYGAATKQQIQYVVTKQLHLSSIPQPDDAADALAAALCAI